MPMERDKHEEILNKLLLPDTTQSDRTELLQELRADYSMVLTDFDEITQSNEKLSADNSDLVVSNSKLFRQIGVTGTGNEKEIEKENYSETVTLEQLEQANN